MFSRSRTLTIISFDFLAGFFIALPTLFNCCHVIYYIEYFVSEYEDPDTWLANLYFIYRVMYLESCQDGNNSENYGTA